MGLTPVLVRSPGVENVNPLQYSFLENPMERGAWQATVHGVTMSQTRLSDYYFGASLVAQKVKNLQCGRFEFDLSIREIHWRREFLLGEFCG